jgi:2'-5' RNA ligase
MSALLALDVALLLPPDVRDLAVRLSSSLSEPASPKLEPKESASPKPEAKADFRLDADHLPHITLTQQFVRVEEVDAAFERIDETLRGERPLSVRVTGGGKGHSSVWMAIERTEAIASLHERLMESLRGLERPGGTAAAFFEGDARVGDVAWVTGYRLKSSLSAYHPHVTLGYAAEPPAIEPFTFEASSVAACHLGRFCSCRMVLRSWELV